MKIEQIIDEFQHIELITADGFDDCIIGVAESCERPPVIAYDRNKIIRKLSRDMSEEDALEYFYYNILGAHVGEQTPIFIET
jgi:hypothetical protein